ncbi:hypothetical protein V492_02086, partial [Pseudogymnoascus sp. VKM F-4246]
LNPTPPAADATCTADALSLRVQLLPLLEEGKDVVVVCHSYGGIPAGGAARGLAKKEREARDEKGGVLGLIYLTSFVVPEGVSLVQFLGGQHAPYVQQNQTGLVCSLQPTVPGRSAKKPLGDHTGLNGLVQVESLSGQISGFELLVPHDASYSSFHIIINHNPHSFQLLTLTQPSPGLCLVSPPIPVLYADVPAPLASTLEFSLLPHSLAAFDSTAPAPAWAEPAFAGRIAFLKCSADVALPPFLQDLFIEKSGVEWLVREVETGHSPWASRPEELAEIIGGWVEVFAG